uniref:Uncharacterized protein n=1 Tax=uncultured marine group II/III euryarchaeote KM3_67_D09 TaxID=1456483 RepID=A0A075HH55_9EURY|nr:hypothetical protein [uncultured marine group II/III euryarchaeote KM3_67_D09]
MEDLEIGASVVGVFLAKSMEAVRAGSHDTLDTKFLESHHIGLSEHLEEVLITRATSRVSRASFLHSENANIQSSLFQQANSRAGDFLIAFIEARCTADEVDVLGWLTNLDVEPLSPVSALMHAEAVWVRSRLEVTHRDIEFFWIFHRLHHRIAPQIGQFRHMLDVHWASVHARVAGSASPDRFCAHSVKDALIRSLSLQKNWSMFIRVIADVVDNLHRIERLSGLVSWTDILATYTSRARPTINQLPPTKLLVTRYAECFDVEIL